MSIFFSNPEIKAYQTPQFIQRGIFNDIEDNDIKGIDSLIMYEYMNGNIQFDLRCAASIDTIVEYWKYYVIVTLKNKDIKKQNGYIICHKCHQKEIQDSFNKLISCKINTIEPNGLKEYFENEKSSATNFWWDINNNWMCCFGKNHLNKLIKAMQKVHEKKKGSVPNFGPQYEGAETIIDECDFPKIYVTQINGRKTTIDTRNIIEVKLGESNMSVVIRVKKNSGGYAFLIIETPDKTKILYERLKEICKIEEDTL